MSNQGELPHKVEGPKTFTSTIVYTYLRQLGL